MDWYNKQLHTWVPHQAADVKRHLESNIFPDPGKRPIDKIEARGAYDLAHRLTNSFEKGDFKKVASAKEIPRLQYLQTATYAAGCRFYRILGIFRLHRSDEKSCKVRYKKHLYINVFGVRWFSRGRQRAIGGVVGWYCQG